MNEPKGKEGEAVAEAVEALRKSNHFGTFIDWIKSERDKRDIENRQRDNDQPTEAAALTTILKVSGYKSNAHV